MLKVEQTDVYGRPNQTEKKKTLTSFALRFIRRKGEMRDDGLYHPPVADAAVLASLFIYFFKGTQQEMCRHWNSFSFFRNNWRDNLISDI